VAERLGELSLMAGMEGLGLPSELRNIQIDLRIVNTRVDGA